MKEATGELNMTVITLIAIAAIAALFYVFVWPMIQRTIAQQTCNTYGTDYNAVAGDEVEGTTASTTRWFCCKGDTQTYNATDCIAVTEDEAEG